MRIRKNAKISTLFYTHSNLSNNIDECLLQKNLCLLNQSPWDIITFPSEDSSSSFHQFDDYEVYYDVNYAGNGSSIGYLGDLERKFVVGDDVASVKNLRGKNDNLVDPEGDHTEILTLDDEEMNEDREEILLCDVRDEKGWQCGKVVKNGETICDHHIIENRNHAVWSNRKKSGPVAGTRARKSKKRASTSPYEFYYYSGFGPSWGKKRGTGSNDSIAYDEPVTLASEDINITETASTINNTGIQKEEEKGFEPETFEVRPENMKVAYIDGGDNKKGKTGKKRGRKPIKARSLKSLM